MGKRKQASVSECEDSSAFWSTKSTFGVGCFDGAGSKTKSAYGSQLLRDTVVRATETTEFDSAASNGGSDVYRVLCEFYKRAYIDQKFAQKDWHEYYSTCVFAIFSRGFIRIGHVGDGIIGILNSSGGAVVSWGTKSQFANTTTFFQQKSAAELFKFQAFADSDVQAVFTMTDGLDRHLVDRATGDFSPQLLRMLREPSCDSREGKQHMRNVLAKIVDATNEPDDCSMAVMWRTK